MAVHNLEGSQGYHGRRVAGSRYGTMVAQDAALILTREMPTVVTMTPTAARNIDLPAITAGRDEGLFFWIINAAPATFALTVRLTGGGATVGTVAATKGAFFVVAGGTWRTVAGA